ncbi:MAG TPA: site-2 protease family protein [Planctomycetota bacterium]
MEQTLDRSVAKSRKSTSLINGIPIGRFLGIDVRLDPSWFVVFALITFTLHSSLWFGHPDVPGWQVLVAALVGSVLFFASILAHELSHSVIAKGIGLEVRGITLFLFGGVSGLKSEPRKAPEEAAIAIVGPVTSVVLGALFLLLQFIFPAGSVGRDVVGWLGFINLMLAAFNLLPGFPLDGGRLLRAAIWGMTGDVGKATRVAATSGTVIAVLLITLGLLEILFIPAAMLGGLWLAFIGWFLLTASRQSRASYDARRVLETLRVDQVMRTDCVELSPDEPLDHLVERRILRSGPRCYVVARAGLLEGLITLREIRDVPRESWHVSTVGDAMVPVERVRAVSPTDTLLKALDLMQEAEVNQLPVVSDGRLAGMITREDVLRAISIHLELGGDGVEEPAAPTRGQLSSR